MTGLRALHPHQRVAMDGLRRSIASGHRRPMLQAPTGSGKTVLAAHVVSGARGKGNRVTFCVPSIGLVDQTFERFVENGIDPADMGVIQADHPWRRPAAPIQIATAQSLARRDLPDTDVVVIDEAHVLHKIYQSWMDQRPDAVFIGLSATPWSQGLGKRFDDLIKPTSTQALIDAGLLSKFRVWAPSTPDLSAVKTVAGDYHEGQLGEVMSGVTIVGDVVSNWLARGENRPTLCFAVNRAHAEKLYRAFAETGVAAAYIDANTPREEREAIGRQLHAGAVKVVVNIGCLTTGIDWDVRCLILARPTKSEMLFVQIIGRALRPAPGKDHAIILDHTGTHQRLGMVTDIDFSDLDHGKPKGTAEPRKREKSLPLPKLCGACLELVPVTMQQCPGCGAELQSPTGVATVDGELAEFGGVRGSKPKGSVRDAIASQGRQAVYSQLLGHALARGKPRGWVSHRYHEVFGVWPSRLKELPVEPIPLMVAWLKSRAIVWAKSAQARGGRNAAV